MISRNREKKDWAKPFALVHSSTQFLKIQSDYEVQESMLSKKKKKKPQEIIISPKIQILEQVKPQNGRGIQMPKHYIKIHRVTNVPLRNFYELTEVEMHFMDAAGLRKMGISEQNFIKILVRLQYQSVNKGLQFQYEKIFWDILISSGLKRPRKFRKKHDEQLVKIFTNIFNFWKKKRIIYGYGNYPFYRPLWKKNDLAGGPFKTRFQDKIVLRNRKQRFDDYTLEHIIREDLLKLKKLANLIIEREEKEIQISQYMIDRIQKFEPVSIMRKSLSHRKKEKESSRKKKKDQTFRNEHSRRKDKKQEQKISYMEERKSERKNGEMTLRKKKQKSEKKHRFQTEKQQDDDEGQDTTKYNSRGRYTKDMVQALQQDQAEQEYQPMVTRKYYLRGNYRHVGQQISSSFQKSLEGPVQNLIQRFQEKTYK